VRLCQKCCIKRRFDDDDDYDDDDGDDDDDEDDDIYVPSKNAFALIIIPNSYDFR